MPLLLLRLTLVVCLIPGTALASEPEISWHPEIGVRIARLPDVLGDEAVREHLDSGLTTTFMLQARLKGSGAVGGARLEVRFEPWDEVFYAAATGMDGKISRQTCASMSELQAWWSGLVLPIFAAEGKDAPAGRVTLRMDVIPFSASERRDTLRWLSDLREEEDLEDSGPVAEDSAALVSQTVQVILATSIRRRAIKTFRWNGVLRP